MASTDHVAHRRPTSTQRAASVVALVALAASVALVAIGAAASWLAILLAVAGVLLAVLAGWSAIAHHGAHRRLAAAVAFGGVVVLVAGLVALDLDAGRTVAVLALVGICVGSARVALRRDESADDLTPAPPANHPVLLINPRSGGGKAGQVHLVDECRARGIEAVVLQPGDDLRALAEDAITRGADLLGMAGGDGSQALVAATAIAHDLPVFVVPSGTRNHFALDLGLDRNDILAALDACTDGVERRIDVATVNGRVFVNNASLGVYATIVQSPEYRNAKRQTVTSMLPELIGPGSRSVDLRFTDPDGEQHTTAHVLLVSNDPYRLHRLAARRGRRKRMDLGVLGIASARITTAREASRFVALEATGHGRRFPGLRDWTAPTFRVDSAAPVEIGVDGEALRLEPPLEFASVPGALRVRIPRAAATRTPVASVLDVLSTSTARDLVAVASGR